MGTVTTCWGEKLIFIIKDMNYADRKLSFNEFEWIRKFIEDGQSSYTPYIGRILASQKQTSRRDSYVNYSCINGKPATRYIVNAPGHFDHWHVNITPKNTTIKNLEKAEGRNTPIQYETEIENGTDGNKTLVIKFPMETGAIYSFLLFKPDYKSYPNSNPNSFTKVGDNMETRSIMVNDKTFTYTFDPTNAQNPQIRITSPVGEGDISVFNHLDEFRVRVNKFYVSSQSILESPSETLYSKEKFINASSCTSEDISLKFQKCTAEGSVGINPSATYLDFETYMASVYILDETMTPGSFIEIQGLGDWQSDPSGSDNIQNMAGVFALVSAEGIEFLSPGPLTPAGLGVITPPPPPPARLRRDISEDFNIRFDSWIRLQVPALANVIAFSAIDSTFYDNSDPDGDYGVKVRWQAPKGHTSCLSKRR